MTDPVQTLAPPVPAEALQRRPAEDRGHADHGWLKARFSFSFAEYHDPENLHFEALRVINDDHIAAGGKFPMHPHRDFEIFTYVLDGAITHRDSMGNGSTVSAGGVQFMTAGTGVMHSEENAGTEPLHSLQIWLLPKVRGATPRYETRQITPAEKQGRLVRFVAEDGAEDAIATHAPADVYAGTFDGDQSATFELREGRRAYVHVARGALSVNGVALSEGDGLRVMEGGTLTFGDGQDAEILLFDLERVGRPSA